MKGSYFTQKRFGASAVSLVALSVVLSINFFSTDLRAQGSLKTSNQFICADVKGQDGYVTVLLPGNGCRIGFDPQLCFESKCYFTCQINGTYFTNNEVIAPFPSNAKRLNDGTSKKIGDTIYTTWLNKNGCDIIQEIYPVAFTKSGQIVYKWKITNKTGVTISVPSQYLQDVQITDQNDPSSQKSNDGPKILTKWQYTGNWVQYPNSTYTSLPWFYIGFLHNLPNVPSYNPGLSAQGYLEYGAPLNLTKPFRMTNGDWYTMAQTIFGSSGWPVNGSTFVGSDNAVLLEFPAVGVPAGKTVEISRTSYGTGEFEKCFGQLFSLVFYPHHLVWRKDIPVPPGSYSPNPIHIEKFVVVPGPPENNTASANTKITLTVGPDLTLSDSLCKTFFGKSQVKPPAPSTGTFIGPGGVAYFDWWACANPAYFCSGTVKDTLKFTGTCGFCPPAFLNEIGADQCDQTILIDCAETDMDAPEYSDTLVTVDSASVVVHDWRASDRGLKSITWAPVSGTNPAMFVVKGPTPAVKPCFTDKINHRVTVVQLDSTIGGCFDFTFEDCLGHKAFHQVCILARPRVLHPDTLKPIYSLLKRSGSFDGSLCNNRLDSFEVSDNRDQYEKGIDSVFIIPGTDSNMNLTVQPFTNCPRIVRFTVTVADSMKDGNLCVRAVDCKNPNGNYSDTCFHYCTIADTIAPKIDIFKDPGKAGLWNVSILDNRAWDRGLAKIFIIGDATIPSQTITVAAADAFTISSFTIISSDTTQKSSFCIEAEDLAGNHTAVGAFCGNQGIGKDEKCPNIKITPQLPTNQSSIDVDVNDIHQTNPPQDTSKYVWDNGIDQVWFTNNTGMTTPAPISGNGAMTIPTFNIHVTDTTKTDSVACVTINASDMKGNTCYTTYCYPYIPDVLPPVMKLWYNPLNHSQILGYVTDSTTYDRGIYAVGLEKNSSTNLTSLFLPTSYNGQKVVLFDIIPKLLRPDLDKSTVGTLGANDMLFQQTNTFTSPNSVTAPIAIWVQDFTMPKGLQPNQNSKFSIPIRFVKNDDYPVVQKGITDFAIGFTLKGDVGSIVFDGVSQVGTESANWTVTTAGTNPVVVTGTMAPSGSPLTADFSKYDATKPETMDSLIVLNFHSTANESSTQVTLSIDSITFNKGLDKSYPGSNPLSSSLMPPPWGNISGSNIVITGACAPRLLSANPNPTTVSLDPNHPNPFSHVTTFNYTVATEGPVRFYIYDALGKVMARIVDQDQKVGTYTVTFDGSQLSGGSYVARLESGGTVVSRRVTMKK